MINRLLLAALLCPAAATSQNTFQKVYNYPAAVQNFGAMQTPDGNYLITGVADAGGQKLFLSKEDCEGNPLWTKTYNASSTVGNVSQRVIETATGHYVMAGSAGTFNAYDMVVVKTDANGNSVWKKMLAGSGDDVVNALAETSDYGLVLAGKTNSYGQDAGTNYRDVYLAKLDSGGNFQWGRTYGTALSYDEAFDVVETPDHGLAVTGRYVADGAFHCLLLKTDSVGTMQYIKVYGDTNHNTTGYALINLPLGGFAITGGTTVLKNNFQAFPDEFLITTDANGDTAFTRAWHGTASDGSESGSSLLMTPDGGFAIGVATFSYPTTGFVPNKHMILRTDKNGNMLFARTYNSGGSHYPYLVKATEGFGYLLSGFSNHYTPDFNPLLIRTDTQFVSGCNETDVTPLTVQQQPKLVVKTPPMATANGGSAANTVIENAFSFTITSLCQNIVDSCTNPVSASALQGGFPFSVFPNPARGKFSISCKGPAAGEFRIKEVQLVNVPGQVVLKAFFRDPLDEAVIDAYAVEPGVYFVRVITVGDASVVMRMVLL